ncbi:MAG: HpaII family restriction endonuclease [Adlercreutzia sp.]|nr:HpaII family restriction endonuclease [Adlercreutzia sp.]
MPLGKANKGEWSEVYAALRLIGDGKIELAHKGDGSDPSHWMEVVEVIRKETKDRIVTYGLDENSTDVVIEVNGSPAAVLPATDFTKAADSLMKEIRDGKRAFEASPEALAFLDLAGVLSTKASSGEKNDIFLTTLDKRTGLRRNQIGFSIKSHFGSNPTLFNTAPASAVIYELVDFDDEQMDSINSMLDAHGHVATSQRCEAIIRSGATPVYHDYVVAKRAKVKAFKENLELLNPLLPNAIEWILADHFFSGSKDVELKDAVQRLVEANPDKITRPEVKYPYMFKAFLYASYCKMTASTLWDGVGDVNGGYIDVTDDGKVVCHYALESEEFKSFLYESAYLDFPDTGPKHGDYAKVYKEDDRYFFKLNFQIRLH